MIFKRIFLNSLSAVACRIHTNRALCSHRRQMDDQPLVWIDLEMTGLDVKNDRIMEIACLVTDTNLNIIADGIDIIIHQPDSVLNRMDDWCKNHHGKTGLTEASRNSKITEQEAQNQILDFVKKYTEEKKSCLAGNTIYMDRLFLMEYMPEIHKYLHYRLIDVSTVKELCRNWNPDLFKQAPKKVLVHRALSDIQESVEELKYYKNFMFNK